MNKSSALLMIWDDLDDAVEAGAPPEALVLVGGVAVLRSTGKACVHSLYLRRLGRLAVEQHQHGEALPRLHRILLQLSHNSLFDR